MMRHSLQHMTNLLIMRRQWDLPPAVSQELLHGGPTLTAGVSDAHPFV
jgi:hypothetical protein